MGKKVQERAAVLAQEQIADGIFSLLLRSERIAAAAAPGQFVSVYCEDKSRLLPRPISICEYDRTAGTLRLVYRVAGKGTAEFSACRAGDRLDLIGPLGNGFPPAAANEGQKALLVGGGIGIPPILQLAKELQEQKEQTQSRADVQVLLGYRDERFLEKDFRTFLPSTAEGPDPLLIATEDGSFGTKGNVMDCIREYALRPDVIYACGPTPMLRAVREFALGQNIPCYLSLEQRMACGIGACLACVCQSAQLDEHSQVHNKRVCAEGPVFSAEEIVL